MIGASGALPLGAARAQDAAPAAPATAAPTTTTPATVAATRTVYLYAAVPGRAPGINAARRASWGNGLIEPERRVDYEGAPVLRVTTRNFQEGVRFDLDTPADFDAYREQGFLRLRLRFADAGATGGDAPGGVAANPLMKPRWNGNAQFGGALPPLGGDPAPADAPATPDGTAPEAAAQQTDITALGVTLWRERGASSGLIPIDLNAATPDENGWRLFVLPIKSLTSTPGAAGAIKRVVLTSDNEDTFYLAQAALAIENGEMSASIRRPEDAAGAQVAEVEAKPGPVTLVADVEAGTSDPTVEWNFDADNVGNLPTIPAAPGGETPQPDAPAPDPAAAPAGPRLDARGLTATFSYPNEEQNYRVEVTVRDRSGQKAPITASILVKVRG